MADKTRHLEFVLLKPEEYDKLIKRFGQSLTGEYIERLNNYIGSTGKRYKSHYHTILVWADNDKKKAMENQQPQIKPYINADKLRQQPQDEDYCSKETAREAMEEIRRRINSAPNRRIIW